MYNTLRANWKIQPIQQPRTMTERLVKVLHVTPAFYPAVAYGGPIVSTKMIVDGIAALPDFQVRVLSTDISDPSSGEHLRLPENPATFPSGYSVQYCRNVAHPSVSPGMIFRLPKAIRWADIVHLTGPYDFYVLPTLLLCRAFSTPVVWSPRGGFQATAQWKNSPKTRLKHAFERLAGLVLSRRHTTLHTTSEFEAVVSQRNLGTIDTSVIPNAVEIPDIAGPRLWKPDGRFRIAFLSRIHPKKGLNLLVDAVQLLPERFTLDIYGSGSDTYVAELKDKVESLDLTSRVKFHGLVSGIEKARAFTNCDIFCLPTYSENFGIVVAEALSYGTPVVTTTNAPWSEIETNNCGRWIEAGTPELVEALSALENADLEEMGQRGRAWIQSEFSAGRLTRQFANLYHSCTTCGTASV
ncbi:glycosyltransferase [Sinisalibacter aestuarii]|uniref:glycosyltransferase n=1 Tax=Sinisalibacter aestuarii TaxID=2949426 RepID=UPI0024905663|nr:glycosyltransferase [Sinisalibacter aestuarii]